MVSCMSMTLWSIEWIGADKAET